MGVIKLIIFDFDGTLFDTSAAITTSIQKTFEAVLPSHSPSLSDIHAVISNGYPLKTTYKSLQPPGTDLAEFDAQSEVWAQKHRENYSLYGQALSKPYPGAGEVLRSLVKSSEYEVAIISSKAVTAIKTSLEKHGLDNLVPDDLIIGEPLFKGKPKPNAEAFTEALLPRLGSEFASKEGEILMVGDTVADILFAKNIGAKVAWCSFGQGNQDACAEAKPDFTIQSLLDVQNLVA
ncbi:HAD family hydrolase [Aspergillus stella-maris]|uniref:HAD family hydrolase n=1 Tax=Aspergillus stella-maris TaxID=1810926 RepID=UPI003CCD12F4